MAHFIDLHMSECNHANIVINAEDYGFPCFQPFKVRRRANEGFGRSTPPTRPKCGRTMLPNHLFIVNILRAAIGVDHVSHWAVIAAIESATKLRRLVQGEYS